jgi:hypothetical protein
MLEGMQQTYPGATSAYPPSIFAQGGLNNPFGGLIGSGVHGLFGNGGIGRTLDPVTQAYLQQAQIAQQLTQQGNVFGTPQWGGPMGLDPFTAAYVQHIVHQHQLAHLLGQQGYGSGFPLQNIGQNMGPIGRPFGVDPIIIALMQQQLHHQQQLQQPYGQSGFGGQQFGQNPFQNFGGSPFGRQPFQSQMGVGAWS